MMEISAFAGPTGWDKMSNNGSGGSYANERPPSTVGDPEYCNDLAASGSFFSSDYKRHEDLKTMLDSNKDGLKLEAMKRIIGMVAKGKDASDLFPAVVKNVVSKNIEVKKLVYVYLVRYAEEQQDLALLSISTFQRALKDPNQLIRASALRVLSSIRVPVIIPIVMLAIKDAVNDMSPYVRKTVAHAIPKLYSLDPEQKDQLIEVIEKLLADKTTLVVGSAVMAFEEVCPERIDLIHKNYRKLCNLLVDVEEWGQVVIMKMLTHYARTQFIDPNRDDVGNDLEERPFYEEDEKEVPAGDKQKPTYTMDNDHRLLLRISKPLLQSRNTSVVMAVAQLYHHLAPRTEVNIVAKSLIRLLRNHREVQSVVLSNIATMSTKRRGMFEPYLKSFFIRSSDPTHIKILKLEILTNLATDSNISIILREFQTYVSSTDKEFVAATIQAIGRCASNIKEVTDTCLNGLVSLMSNRSEAVVAESVVVIKKLLQMQPSEHKDIIIHTSRLVDNITVPMARASILWLLGEYSDLVPKIAPDVLRKMAKTFIHEEDIVKLQVLNLATKLYLTNPKQTKLLSQYIFNLAKYDQNYDIRDRSRFLRQLIFSSGDHENVLAKHCKKIFLSTKPAPLLESKFKDRDQYQLGSLSHFINMRASGYHDLPDFPQVAPDPSVRNVEVTITWTEPSKKKNKQQVKMKSFYSDSDSSSQEASSDSDDSDDSGSEAGSSDSGGSDDGSDKSGSSSGEDSDGGDKKVKHSKPVKQEKKKKPEKKIKKKSVSTDGDASSSGSDSSSSDSSSSDSSSEESSSEESSEDQKSKNKSSEDEEVVKKPKKESTASVSKKTSSSKPAPKSSRNTVDLLLDLNDIAAPATSGTGAYTSISGVGGGILTPTPLSSSQSIPEKMAATPSSAIQMVYSAMYVPVKYEELFNKVVGGGVSAEYRFTRSQNAYSSKMISVELAFTNHSDKAVNGIKVGKKNLAVGMEIYAFPEIESLAVGATMSVTIGIDFNQTTQPATFEIVVGEKSANVSIKAPIGELIQAVALGEHEFASQLNKLKGLNENTIICEVSKSCMDKGVVSRVYEVANMMQIQTAANDQQLFRFAAQSMSTNSLVLLAIKLLDNGKASVTINCEKIVISSMLLKELKVALGK